MPVDFSTLQCGDEYSRPRLAEMWGYAGFQALARGVVTPRNSNTIILFATAEKRDSQEQYDDRLSGDILHWEGPTDHFAERRMICAEENGDEIHVFFREKHHADFRYLGLVNILEVERFCGRPSKFKFQIQ